MSKSVTNQFARFDNVVIPVNFLKRTDWHGHENAVFDVDWVPGENRLVTASGDQSAILWDVETQEKLVTCKGHTSSVRTVNCLVSDKSKSDYMLISY